jgi:hypothetical protein
LRDFNRSRHFFLEPEVARDSAALGAKFNPEGVKPHLVGNSENRPLTAERINDSPTLGFVKDEPTGYATGVNPHGAAPWHVPGISQNVRARMKQGSASRVACYTQHVGKAWSPEGDSSRGTSTHNLMPQQTRTFALHGLVNQVPLVDPLSLVADIALVEDGNPRLRDPSDDTTSGFDEPFTPLHKACSRQLRHIG